MPFKLKFYTLVIAVFLSMHAVGQTEELTVLLNGEVTSNGINVRNDSTISSTVLGQVDKGQQIEISKELYGWYKIKLPLSVPAFISKDMVSSPEKKTNSDGTIEKVRGIKEESAGNNRIKYYWYKSTAMVLKDRVNVRLEPDLSSLILAKASKGELVTIIGEAENFYRIEPTEKSFGWIHSKFVRKTPKKTIVIPQTKELCYKNDNSEIPLDNKPAPSEIKDLSAESSNELSLQEKKKQIETDIHTNHLDVASFKKHDQTEKNTGITAGDPHENTNLIEIEGIVKPFGKVINRAATHKLICRDKKTYLLKYDALILNSLTFHAVKVKGDIKTIARHKYPIIEVKNIERIQQWP